VVSSDDFCQRLVIEEMNVLSGLLICNDTTDAFGD